MNEWHYAAAVCAAINGNTRPSRPATTDQGDNETTTPPGGEGRWSCASNRASGSASKA